MYLAYFTAPGCGVCREKGPIVEEIARETQLPLERWDTDEEAGRDQAERRRIRAVPTLALVRGERVPFRLVGAMITSENVRHLLGQVAG